MRERGERAGQGRESGGTLRCRAHNSVCVFYPASLPVSKLCIRYQIESRTAHGIINKLHGNEGGCGVAGEDLKLPQDSTSLGLNSYQLINSSRCPESA